MDGCEKAESQKERDDWRMTGWLDSKAQGTGKLTAVAMSSSSYLYFGRKGTGKSEAAIVNEWSGG